MASHEAMRKVMVGRTTEYRKGTDTELLALHSSSAELLLLCGERFDAVQAFRTGRLSLHMIRAKGNPVCMVSCMVGDHQWMLAKDSLVLRVDPRKYVFAMPGFCYGLALLGSGSDHECRTLDEILARFCAYRDIAAEEGADIWAHAYDEMTKLTTIAAAAIDTTTGGARRPSTATGIASSESEKWKKIQRAVRTSAMVKLLSRSLLSGALDPRKHLDLTAGNNLPSMRVIGDLADVIETRRRPPAVDGGNSFWYVNGEGIRLLLAILSACGAAERRKRPRLDTLREESEWASEGNAGDEGGGVSSSGSRCLSKEVSLEREKDDQ
ncbi:hypothetical protein C4D60_Mb09t11820 [Musa balbisiana]|uniref:Uncharacterized protein n=1 Tax=Musa balbisiana TaxID=52838 RepID=A0A4S8IFQ4_MUSBA|nr:hypothetical protein C4D60_Mb09t11820 [Musa balbisiana]